MHSSSILFYTAIFLQSLLINGQSSQRFISGSLSGNWDFNYTFFMKEFDGTLYFVDYERNNLILMIQKIDNSKTNVSVRYNYEFKKVDMNLLCGCNPCEEKMMNIVLKAYNEVIEIICNKVGRDTLRKDNIKDGINRHIPKPIIDKIDQKGQNNLYTEIKLDPSASSVDKIGCLESLYYNGVRMELEDIGNTFLSTCPRSCPIGDCHEGKCRALDPFGPTCDCWSTALSGSYCNNSMLPYNRNRRSQNTFYRVSLTGDIHIKLAWLQKSPDKKFCLLDFVNEYGQVTWSIQQNFLLRGTESVAQIYGNAINFIDIKVTNGAVTIKVNNKLTQDRTALLGNLKVNVGFTEKLEHCETFDGTYYFLYNPSQLSHIEAITTVAYHTPFAADSKAATEFKIDVKIIILGSGSSLLVTIVFLAILLMIICIRRYRSRKDILAENVYDGGYRKANHRINTDLNIEDPYHYDALEYDRLNPSRFSIQTTHAINNELPELPPRNSQC